MRQVSDNVWAEIYFWGCNPGFLTTSEGVFMIDTPQQPLNAVQWRERIAEHGPIRHLVNTEPHGDHIMGNAYFPGVEVIGQTLMEARYEEAVPRMQSDERVEQMLESDPDSVWLLQHPSYPPNPPTRLFDRELTIQLGEHTIELQHIPGHTLPQTAVFLPDEGVVFTGDNVFHRMMTFVQEADPWEWLEALKRIEALGAEVIVPGHGEPCDNGYLNEQANVLEGWIDAVEGFVKRGLTEEEALREPRPDVDPYPIGQRLYPATDRIKALNVGNVYRHVIARQSS